jgi:UDP-N-acetylglucosamine--N-acetylmuramyl-(pentapeptide) pyrophosphoryl-undecaprenol N-acetylglucosamine transferase
MWNQSPLFLFAGGGTGGHLFPGVAVAEELLTRLPAARVLFAGSDRDVESAIVSSAAFRHVALPSPPSTLLRRHPLRFAVQYLRARRKARQIVAEHQPAAVIGLGGFASVPLVVEAHKAGVAVVLLEQNAVAGRATRRLARLANVVCHAFRPAGPNGKSGANAVVTGNPVRRSIAALADHRDQRTQCEPLTTHHSELVEESWRMLPASACSADAGSVRHGESPIIHTLSPLTTHQNLLVLGGSQGSAAVNEAVLSAVEELREQLAGWSIVHQCGPNDGDRLEAAYRRLGIAHVVQPFFDDMPRRYAAAGIAVSRAGATTLAELACTGVPAVLIPYPNAIYDHQLRNAEIFAAAGAAEIVPQQRTAAETGRQLASALQPLLRGRDDRRRRAAAMGALAAPDAASRVVDCILSAESLVPPASTGAPHFAPSPVSAMRPDA